MAWQVLVCKYGSAGQAVGVAGTRARRADGARAGAGQQRQEHAAERAAPARAARAAHHAHRRTTTRPLPEYACFLLVQLIDWNILKNVQVPLSTRLHNYVKGFFLHGSCLKKSIAVSLRAKHSEGVSVTYRSCMSVRH